MKNRRDVEARLWAELEQWRIQQSRRPDERFYLYILPYPRFALPGFIFCSKRPANPDVVLGDPVAVNGYMDIETNFHYFRDKLMKLPVLEVEDVG